ncbi:ECF transporter S component [Enterococcus sp. 2201sp1_2201st1_B8_2201SCRN_220225]|uniref:ECF transporter S component n=1 Tax=unclassified Enterococcus TaxID=2608891 RepID=UPI0034A38F8E
MTKSTLTARRIAYLALLSAACVVGRLSFTFLPNVQPMTAILLLLTLLLSLPEALLVMSISLVVTNLFVGLGIWTVGQFLSYLGIMLLFWLLARLPLFKTRLWLQALLAAAMGFLYGFLYSIFNYFLYGMSIFWPYWLQGLPFDALHAGGNLVFYLLLFPVFQKLFKQFLK